MNFNGSSRVGNGYKFQMDRLTDEFIPVFMGITEADEVYGVIMYARRGDKPYSAQARVIFYVFDGKEIYNAPVSGVAIDNFEAKNYSALYRIMKLAFKHICEGVASYGINVYDIRDAAFNAAQLERPFVGKIAIQKQRK